MILRNTILGGDHVSKRKADPSTIGLSSSETEGQGTTTRETGRKKADSSRKKQSGISTAIKEDGKLALMSSSFNLYINKNRFSENSHNQLYFVNLYYKVKLIQWNK